MIEKFEPTDKINEGEQEKQMKDLEAALEGWPKAWQEKGRQAAKNNPVGLHYSVVEKTTWVAEENETLIGSKSHGGMRVEGWFLRWERKVA